MRKKLLCLTMALAMLAGTGVTAQAEDLQGKDGWFAEFNGKKIVSNFDSAALVIAGRRLRELRRRFQFRKIAHDYRPAFLRLKLNHVFIVQIRSK